MTAATSIEPQQGPAIEFDAVHLGFDEGDVLRASPFK